MPLTVRKSVPVVALPLAVSVMVLLVLVLVGLNDPVTPFGKALAERFTVPVKLFCGLTVTVAVAVEL